MSTNSIVKSVAKELKYYCDVKRLEDGFDLSGVHNINSYKVSDDQLLRMAYDNHGPREERVKRKIKKHMTNYHFLLTDPTLPHLSKRTKSAKSKHKKGPKIPEYYYIYTARPQILPPRSTTSVGTRPAAKHRSVKSGRSLSRSTPASDTNRLVNAAAKLLVATETVESLDSARSPRPQTAPRSFESGPGGNRLIVRVETGYDFKENQRPHTAKYAYDINGRKVFNTQLKYYDDSSSPSETNIRRTQSSRSPVRRPGSPTPSYTSDDTPSSSLSIDDVNRLKKPAPRTSKSTKSRTYISDNKKTEKEEVAVSVSMQTEFNDSVGIQTERRLLEKYDHMEDEVKEGPVAEYEVVVVTGSVNGASTKADVRITLYGENGRTKEIMLSDSQLHKLKFQKGKDIQPFEDKFVISAHHVGELRKIKIGHDRPELSYAWYLESVTVSDLHSKKVYDFQCNRWLTGQSGDRNTYVQLPVERDRNFVENKPITPYESTVPRVKPKVAEVSKTPKMQPKRDVTKKQRKPKYESESDNSSMEVVNKNKSKSQKAWKSRSESESTYTSDSYTATQSDSESEEDESREETIISLKDSPTHTKKDNLRKISNDSSNKANGPTFTFISKDKKKNTPEKTNGNKERKKTEEKREKETLKDDKKDRKRSSKSRHESTDEGENKMDFLKGYRAGLEAAEKDSLKKRESQKEEDKRILTQGQTIHEAAWNGNIERIKQLVDRFPEMTESKDEKGLVPLHKAVINGQSSVTKWLAASGVELNKETPTSYTPMHLAALHGHVNIMMILAAMGAEVNCESVEKQTPLHLAARGGHLDCVKWLVANRSVITAEDSFGRKPVYLAEEFEKDIVADFLRACERELSNPNSGFAKMYSGSSPTQQDDKESYQAEVGSVDEDSTMTNGTSTTTGSDIRRVHVEERRKSYDAQHVKMAERGKSFLDSIRQDIDEDD